MPAAAERRGDRREVVLAARAHAHLEATVLLLLQHRGDVDVARGSDHVDQVLGVARVHTGFLQVGLREVGPHEVGLGDVLEPAERERRARAGTTAAIVLVERLHQARVIEVVLAQAGGHAQGLGRRGLVLELAGVGDEPRVQAHRRLVGHVAAHRVDQAERPSRRSTMPPGSTSGIVPSPSFERWWSIQITSPAFGRGGPQLPEPVERRAVARDHDRRCLREVVRLARAQSDPGSIDAHRGGSSGSFGKEQIVVDAPRTQERRRARASSRARRRRGSRGRRAPPRSPPRAPRRRVRTAGSSRRPPADAVRRSARRCGRPCS